MKLYFFRMLLVCVKTALLFQPRFIEKTGFFNEKNRLEALIGTSSLRTLQSAFIPDACGG